MSDKTRKVGNLFTHEDEKGFTYTQTYFIHVDDWAGGLEPYNIITHGLAGNTAPYDFPAGTYIYDWDRKPAADHWVLTVKCHNDGYSEDSGSLGAVNNPSKAQRQFTMKDFYLDPAFWGIVKAQKDDIGRVETIKKYSSEGVSSTSNGVEFTKDARFSIANIEAKMGDYIYSKVEDGGADGWPTGGPNYDKSPFTTASMATMDPVTWAGVTVKMIQYKVRFYVNKDIMDFVNWNGINPAGDSAFEPPNTICIPTGYTQVNRWRATATTVLEDAKTFNGVLYHSVERTMELAPHTLLWDPTKAGSGGTWTW